MHSKSPGLSSSSLGRDNGDIEMTGFLSVQQKQLPEHSHDISDDEEDQEDDSSQALLSDSSGWGDDEDPRSLFGQADGLWPQIQNIAIESAPTLLFTTIGLLFTGELLDKVAHWRAMKEVHQLIMIVPAILNLKGNLEMNLSARLGTASNVGELDDPAVRRSVIVGNMSLLQVQAAVVSFIAACLAIFLGAVLPRNLLGEVPIPSNSTSIISDSVMQVAEGAILTPRRPITLPKDNYSTFSLEKLVMVASTGMAAASLSSIVLGSFMCTLIMVCRRYGLDPDNIAPPVASCLGDLITLLWMGVVSAALIVVIHTPIPTLVCVLVISFAVFCLVLTLRNPQVRPLLTQGWSPLFGAMLISSGTGIVLDRFASRYEGFALLAIVISGLPGSVGSILISRLSTSLHIAALPLGSARSRKEFHQPSTRLVMMTLLVVTLPVELVFLSVLRGLGWLHLPFLFVSFSIVFFFIAVFISLYVARFLTNFLWSRNCDPDMYALPIHSALMDLVGQTLLAICFEIAQIFIDVKPQSFR